MQSVRVMVEAWPSPPLVVPKPDFLLELQVVALDPPTHFCAID